MKILVVGCSPYLLVRSGRIHRDIILALTQQGHYVESLAWQHDISYFLPNEIGEHYFDHNKKRVSRITPYLGERGGLALFAYETMKKVQPQLVITVGSAADTMDMHAVKSLYPHLFKWIAIITEGSSVINENYKEQLGYPEIILATSKTCLSAISRLVATECEYLPYGPDHDVFYPTNDRCDPFGVIASGKNSQISNLTTVIKSISEVDGLDAYIHTNIDDPGESDLRLLLRRYGTENRIAVPNSNFVSIREGISDTFMNELYNRYHAVIDVSMQSATALSMLEAMSTGCIPIGVDFGAIGEVINLMPKEYQVFVEFNTLTGPREEEYAVASSVSLVAILKRMRKALEFEKDWFAEASKKSIEVAKIFSKDSFANRLKEVVDRAVSYEHAIVVDSF